MNTPNRATIYTKPQPQEPGPERCACGWCLPFIATAHLSQGHGYITRIEASIIYVTCPYCNSKHATADGEHWEKVKV